MEEFNIASFQPLLFTNPIDKNGKQLLPVY
jgi:hypothetical protein